MASTGFANPQNPNEGVMQYGGAYGKPCFSFFTLLAVMRVSSWAKHDISRENGQLVLDQLGAIPARWTAGAEPLRQGSCSFGHLILCMVEPLTAVPSVLDRFFFSCVLLQYQANSFAPTFSPTDGRVVVASPSSSWLSDHGLDGWMRRHSTPWKES